MSYDPHLEDQDDDLMRVLRAAYLQSARGKGLVRHNPDQLPFTEQKIMTLGRLTGIGGHVYQACKKATEAQTMLKKDCPDAAQAELLGAIVYLAAAYLLVEESR